MMELEFDHGSFDAVLAMYSIIHLPRAEQTTMLQRIYGWLKPGGHFLANFAAHGSEGESVQSWLGSTKGSMYWSGWGQDKTRTILGDLGFEMVMDEVVEDTEEENGVSRQVPFHWVLARKAG
jgi:2-polyprenyl-3-methyl-5-hydroxy-6-metoxy-1,4-benzoquinol methylase